MKNHQKDIEPDKTVVGIACSCCGGTGHIPILATPCGPMVTEQTAIFQEFKKRLDIWVRKEDWFSKTVPLLEYAAILLYADQIGSSQKRVFQTIEDLLDVLQDKEKVCQFLISYVEFAPSLYDELKTLYERATREVLNRFFELKRWRAVVRDTIPRVPDCPYCGKIDHLKVGLRACFGDTIKSDYVCQRCQKSVKNIFKRA